MSIKIKGEEYYLVEDLVEILPLKIDSVRIYLREGRIRGKKIGRLWYVSNSDLRRFLDRGSSDSERIIKRKVQS
ncbi:hypothetical protein ES705_35621 [subsurface metagenome]